MNLRVLVENKFCESDGGQSFVKVNLGSGFEVVPGWIHVEANPAVMMASWPRLVQWLAFRFMKAKEFYSFDQFRTILRSHTFVHHDLERGIPFADGSVDYIFSSHFVEHMRKEAARRLFHEVYRVLKPNGVVRIAVPDLAYAFCLYQMQEKEKALDMFFIENGGSERTRHRYMYDFELLSEELKAAGFRNIVKCDYRQGLTPDLMRLDNRPEETLYVEAFK